MAEHTVYSPKTIDKVIAEPERLAPGHRACIGCGEALAVRLACKALGDNIIIANATGCIEIISSQLPYTSWTVCRSFWHRSRNKNPDQKGEVAAAGYGGSSYGW